MQVTGQEFNHVARCRRVYAHAHDYHINSISNNRLASFMILRMSNQICKKYALVVLKQMFSFLVSSSFILFMLSYNSVLLDLFLSAYFFLTYLP